MAVQNSLSPTVDILNQDTGKVITHYSENADRVVNLSQTSIVRINASPETVNFYERQGNDLIVHMKDGTTVRYQNFFHLDAEGQHSELIFEDDKGVHHALFPFASEAGPAVAEAITPTMADTTLGALTGAEGLTTLQARAALRRLAVSPVWRSPPATAAVPATVKITAYDSSIYGDLKGEVEMVSPDTLLDEVKRDQFYYRVYVRTKSAELKNRNGKRFPILPGMVANVEIKTGQKTVLDYLIKPLNKVKEALRER